MNPLRYLLLLICIYSAQANIVPGPYHSRLSVGSYRHVPPRWAKTSNQHLGKNWRNPSTILPPPSFSIPSAIINGFNGASIVETASISPSETLVLANIIGVTPLGAVSAGGNTQSAAVGRVRFQPSQTVSATSALSGSFLVEATTTSMIGQVNVTATNILRDPNNSTLFWVSGFISSSDSLLATFRYANRQDSLNLIPNVPTGFIFQFNSSSLNVTRQAILLPNMTIDSFTIGTGTSFRSRIYFGGRLYRNTTLGTWPITKLGGIHDGVFAAITFNSTSFTTLSITQKYCTSSPAGSVSVPYVIWAPETSSFPVPRLVASVHQYLCDPMQVVVHSAPGTLGPLSFSYACSVSYIQCAYASSYYADTGAWYIESGTRFFRHFDPVPASFATLSAISAAGDGWINAAASEYNPPGLNHTRWRRIEYDMKSNSYSYPNRWPSAGFVEVPVEALRNFQFGSGATALITSIGSWCARIPVLGILPNGTCDLTILSLVADTGDVSRVRTFGASNMRFSPLGASSASATDLVVATRWQHAQTYTFLSGISLPASSLDDTALIWFSSQPPAPAAPLPPVAAPVQPSPIQSPPVQPPPVQAPTAVPVQEPTADNCRAIRCSNRGSCNLDGGCMCDSGAYGIDCSCNNPVVSASSYCVDGGSREIVTGNVTTNSSSSIVIPAGGILTINGSLTLVNSTLRVSIGPSLTSGQLVVDGCVELDGVLVLDVSEQQIQNGSSATILRSTCISGNFTRISVESKTQPCLQAQQTQDSTSLSVLFTVSDGCGAQSDVNSGGIPWYFIAVPVIVVVVAGIVASVIWLHLRKKNSRRASTTLRRLRASAQSPE